MEILNCSCYFTVSFFPTPSWRNKQQLFIKRISFKIAVCAAQRCQWEAWQVNTADTVNSKSCRILSHRRIFAWHDVSFLNRSSEMLESEFRNGLNILYKFFEKPIQNYKNKLNCQTIFSLVLSVYTSFYSPRDCAVPLG